MGKTRTYRYISSSSINNFGWSIDGLAEVIVEDRLQKPLTAR